VKTTNSIIKKILLAILITGTLGSGSLAVVDCSPWDPRCEGPGVVSIDDDNVIGNHYVIKLHGPISSTSVEVVSSGLALAKGYGLPLFIDIDSPGGSVMAELQIANMIRQSDVYVVTYANGMAASAAAMILMLGDHRIASPHSLILTHYTSGGLDGGNKEDMRKALNSLTSFDEIEEYAIMIATGLTLEEVKKHLLRPGEDVIVPTLLAKKLNVVFEISDDPLDTKPDVFKGPKGLPSFK
jgi:ATP-dependent protease ClpP protease subunit